MPARTVLHVLPHTHWDREWYEPFESYRFRLVRTCDALLDLLDREPRFHFHFDGQTAAIEDYLAVRPHAEPRVAAHVAAGRLLVGPFRILMDEFLCSPETIVRNLRQGLATATRLGVRPRIGYIPDSFGHIAQMPQILRLAGMEDALVWRGVPAAVDRPAFTWVAPDGTALRTLYMATSYSNAATLPSSFEDLMVRAKRIVADMEPFGPDGVVLGMNGSDHLAPAPDLVALLDEANARQDEIEFRMGPLTQYAADAVRDGLPVWEGEMRSSARANVLMGVLSARMPLKQAEFAASRALERYAEPLAAIAGFDPGGMLDEAWRGMVENSAHDSVCGCGIDAVALAVASRYERATRIGLGVRDASLQMLAERIACTAPDGRTDVEGVLVWNPSPQARSGVCEAVMALPGHGGDADLISASGTRHVVQRVDETEQVVVDMVISGAELARIVPTIHSRMMGTLHVNKMELTDGRVRTVRLELGPIPLGHFDVEAAKHQVETAAKRSPRAKFHVIGTGPPLVRLLVDAPEVGGLGWTTLFPAASEAAPHARVSASGNAIANEHVRIELAADGRSTITRLADGMRLEGVGLIDGGDAGDEYTYCPPQRDALLDAPASSESEIVASGPLEARIRSRQRWRVPAELDSSRKRRARRSVEMPVTLEWAVRAGEPFVRLDVRVDNTAADHRLRLHVPLPFRVDGSDADTAFHVTRRGLTGESGYEHATPTFPSRRWVDASDDARGVAVMHAGTPEYEIVEDAIAVTLLRCVGWLSRQDLSTRSGPAGPMLAAPGAQLIGPHAFSLAIYPHDGDWRAGDVHRVAEIFCYPFASIAVRPREGDLSSSGAALQIAPDAVRLSAIERRGDAWEARIYNASDAACEARMSVGAPLRGSGAEIVDLTGGASGNVTLASHGAPISVPLEPWQIKTVRFVGSAAAGGLSESTG